MKEICQWTVLEWSIDHLLDLLVEAIDTGGETHVHELRLGVHLETTKDGLVNLELENELFALVLGVSLETLEDLSLFILIKLVSGDDGDFLLLVELLIEFTVLLSDLLDEHEALVLSEDLDESQGHLVEVTRLLQAGVEQLDLLQAHTGVLGEVLEALGVGVKLAKVFHVFVDLV